MCQVLCPPPLKTSTNLAPVQRVEDCHVLPHDRLVAVHDDATEPGVVLLLARYGCHVVAGTAEGPDHYLVADHVKLLLRLALDVVGERLAGGIESDAVDVVGGGAGHHLAYLDAGVGAAVWELGCGVRRLRVVLWCK